jgi:hypothetical protein
MIIIIIYCYEIREFDSSEHLSYGPLGHDNTQFTLAYPANRDSMLLRNMMPSYQTTWYPSQRNHTLNRNMKNANKRMNLELLNERKSMLAVLLALRSASNPEFSRVISVNLLPTRSRGGSKQHELVACGQANSSSRPAWADLEMWEWCRVFRRLEKVGRGNYSCCTCGV